MIDDVTDLVRSAHLGLRFAFVFLPSSPLPSSSCFASCHLAQLLLTDGFLRATHKPDRTLLTDRDRYFESFSVHLLKLSFLTTQLPKMRLRIIGYKWLAVPTTFLAPSQCRTLRQATVPCIDLY